MPSITYASGGDILSLVWIEFGLFFAILIFLFISKLDLKYRATVFVVYVISVIISTWSTSSLAYLENSNFINCTSTIIPLAASGFAWWWCVKQTKK